MKVGFVNMHGAFRRKVGQVCEAAKIRGVEVMGLAETNLRGVGGEVQVDGWQWIGQGTEHRVGGVGLLVREELVWREFRGGEGWKAVGVQTEGGWTIVCVVYLWQKNKKGLEVYEENGETLRGIGGFIDERIGRGDRVIIVGDFNARIGEEVGDDPGSGNREGERLREWVTDRNLRIVNGTEVARGRWTWMTGKKRSVIDYAMVGGGIREADVQEMRVEDSEGTGIDSDHKMIWLEIVGRGVRGERGEGRAGVRWERVPKGRWDRFREAVGERWGGQQDEGSSSEEGVEAVWRGFKEGLRAAGETVITKNRKGWRKRGGKGEQRVRAKGNERLGKLRAKVKKAKRKWEQAVCNKDRWGEEGIKARYEKYVGLREKMKQEEQEIMREERTRRKTDMFRDGRGVSDRFWRYRRAKRRRRVVGVLKKKKGGLATTREQIKGELEEHWEFLEGEWTETSGGDQKKAQESGRGGMPENSGGNRGGTGGEERGGEWEEAEERGDFLGREMGMEEVEAAVKQARRGKAVGDDDIPNEFFKEGGEVVAGAALELFNTIIREEEVPEEWAGGDSVMLEKGGDNEVLDNYRGITLQSCVGKIYTKVLGQRLQGDAEERGVHSDLQFAFREGRSATEAAYILGEIVEEGGEGYRLGFLDIKKAYDRVDRDILWRRMREEGYGGKILRLIQGLYEGNEGCFRLGGIKGDRKPKTRGLRQGCVLSPFLFAIYIGGVVRKLEESGMGIRIGGVCIPALIFADDIVVCARSGEELEALLAEVWGGMRELGLIINEEKSLVVTIGGGQGEGDEGEAVEGKEWVVRHEGQVVLTVKEGMDYKYLGIMVSDLGGTEAWDLAGVGDVVVRKAETQAAVIRDELRGSYDRFHEGGILWERVAIPGILYGREVGGINMVNLGKLEAIQIAVGRSVLGVGRRVAGEVVLWELGWLPIKDRVEVMRMKFYERMGRIRGDRCSKVIFEARRDSGWAGRMKRVDRIWEEESQDGPEGGNKWQVEDRVMRKWRLDMDKRVEGKGGELSWKRVYRWRDHWKPRGFGEMVRGREAWIRARTGDWECNLKDWKLGRGVDQCWACGEETADLIHYLLHCRGNRRDRWVLETRLREMWGDEIVEDWEQRGDERKVAEILGLRKGCSEEQRELVICFLREEERKGRKGREEQVTGQRVVGWIPRLGWGMVRAGSSGDEEW